MHYNTSEANIAERKSLRKSLRNNLTPAEATLWRALRGKGAGGWKFRRQQGIGPFILDFYCPELRLCIELDGSVHDYSYEYDQRRTAFLAAQGIRVVRFRNEQVFSGSMAWSLRLFAWLKKLQMVKIQTPPLTPPLEGRGAAAPSFAEGTP